MAKPLNTLLIVTDQHRRDALSAYGNALCPTPHVDRLAREGVRFDNAFTCTAICGPVRASLLTGLLPHHHGVVGNVERQSPGARGGDIRPGIPGLTDFLEGTGVVPYLVGKWHAEGTRVPSHRGFRGHDFRGYAHPGVGVWRDFRFRLGPQGENPYAEWLRARGLSPPAVGEAFQGNNPACQDQELYGLLKGPEESSIPWFVADETIRCMEEAVAGAKPFFVWANFWGPHTPCVVPEPYFSMVDPAAVPQDPAFGETFEGKPQIQRTLSRMWGLYDFGWEVWARIVARYYGYVIQIDRMVGRMLAWLEDRGLLDRTVVAFTADHGDAMGAHRLIEKGEFMYDQTYRIPMVVRHPHCRRPGTVSGDFVYFHDLCPTIVDIAGGHCPAVPDSRSLLPLALGQDSLPRRPFVYGQSGGHFVRFDQRMLRTGERKIVFNTACVSELYDLERDPHELVNRIDDPAYTTDKRALLGLLEEEMLRVEDPLLDWLRLVRPIL